MDWEDIIIETQFRSITESKIDEIALCLENAYPKQQAIGLADGKAGIVLFFCYYNLYRNTNRFSPIIEEFISEVNKNLLNQEYIGLTFASGYGGVFWFLNFLKEDFIELEDLPEEVYLPFFKYSKNKIIDDKNLDFLNGPLGVIFLLNEVTNKKSELMELVKEIRKAGIETESTFSPPVVEIKSLNIRVINLSLSHGISSLIIILCDLYSKHKIPTIKELITKSCNYLVATMFPKNKTASISLFPSWVQVDSQKEDIYGSRLSWCYGDLGNALAIYKVGKTFNDKELIKEALDIFKFNAKRRGFNQTNVKDAEFCHGASGIAHVFNRIFQETKLMECKEAANYWYKQTVEFAIHENLCAGYKTQVQGELIEDFFFFEGIAGIGLSLISSVSKIEPKWDKCLLIS